MSAGVLLDTSVVLKLVRRDEELTDRADSLVNDALGARRPLLIPPLLMIEATNALLQRVRRGTLTSSEAAYALARLAALPLQQVQPPDVYPQVLAFAVAHNVRSSYDALYAVTAQRLGVEFWTADERLLNALGTRAPWVRSLREYAPRGDGSTAL